MQGSTNPGGRKSSSGGGEINNKRNCPKKGEGRAKMVVEEAHTTQSSIACTRIFKERSGTGPQQCPNIWDRQEQ